MNFKSDRGGKIRFKGGNVAELEDSLLHQLKDKVKNVIAVSDAKMPGNIGSALRKATEAALVI